MTQISPAAQQSLADQPRYDCRNAYVDTLAELARTDHRIVGVVNDSIGSSKLDAFKRAFPDRLINVGIAEQDMVGVAAGLANGGPHPLLSPPPRLPPRPPPRHIQGGVAFFQPHLQPWG